MPSIVIPEGYSYVLAAGASTIWLNSWQMYRVGTARAKAGIKYPQAYAEKAEAAASIDALKFNCLQRAHQHTLESVPSMLFATLLTGLSYPTLAAGLCGGWVLGRILFTLGYATGDPEKRSKRGGILGDIMTMGLIFSSTYTAYGLIRAGF